MKTYYYDRLNSEELLSLTKRPAINLEKVFEIVKPIIADIKLTGLKSALNYAEKFNEPVNDEIVATEKDYRQAEENLPTEIKAAIDNAYKNIYKFHKQQLPANYSIETLPGVSCSREYRAIEKVGLYVPGGNAVLPSTILMLGIPAQIAGCKRVITCSPVKSKKFNNALLYAAKLCGIKELYKIGGAQAIGLMAYGDKAVQKVNKIFGPGNQYVTAAKLLVSIDPDGCAIDMPAGPSEVLIIGDKNANASFIAADLLAQAEHGPDSQVIFITNDITCSENVLSEIKIQTELLPRKEFIKEALKNSFILIVNDLEEAIKFSNEYGPEHLILNIKQADKYIKEITNAGSVFIGQYSPETVGDYASGTNHSLPTSGFAKSISGVTVESFMKSISFQTLTLDGLKQIANTVETLAETEGLQAHKNAVSIRLR